MLEPEETANFELFRDCLSAPLLEKFAAEPPRAKKKRHGRKKAETPILVDSIEDNNNKNNDAEELSEFINYIATEVFNSLPLELRTLTYSAYINTPTLQENYSLPLISSTTSLILANLDPTINQTLTTYTTTPSPTTFLSASLSSYLTHLTTAPPAPSQTKSLASGCEICLRAHIPLTYHHLIPRMVHAKALKRGWHTKDELNNVAWLCRACHSFVHRLAGHEELAREYFTVKRLLEREEVRAWAGWCGRVRWKAR